MSAEYRLPRSEASAEANPYLSSLKEVQIQQKTVKTRTTPRQLMDPNPGEVGAGVIHVIERVDEDQFMTMLTDGVRNAFDLGSVAHDVLKIVLSEYRDAKIENANCDSLKLVLSNNFLNGNEIQMPEEQFRIGLDELLSKGVLSPRDRDQYWLNRALFFNGSGVIVIQEYRLLPAR
jgi:hypothetical protein